MSNMVWRGNKYRLRAMKGLAIASLLCVLGYWLGGPWWLLIMAMIVAIINMALAFGKSRTESRPVWTQRCVVCGEVCGMPYSVTHRMDDFVCYNCREKLTVFNDTNEGKEKSRKSTPELAEAIGKILEGKYVGGNKMMKDKKKFRSLKQLRNEYFPKTVEKEKLKDEPPNEVAARILKDICVEMMK